MSEKVVQYGRLRVCQSISLRVIHGSKSTAEIASQSASHELVEFVNYVKQPDGSSNEKLNNI
jgi:O-acetylhomoserine/O-acetylserine sulfhydrylase-like pyridoxal-dependent enzyme